jgi:hypothetical protein
MFDIGMFYMLNWGGSPPQQEKRERFWNRIMCVSHIAWKWSTDNNIKLNVSFECLCAAKEGWANTNHLYDCVWLPQRRAWCLNIGLNPTKMDLFIMCAFIKGFMPQQRASHAISRRLNHSSRWFWASPQWCECLIREGLKDFVSGNWMTYISI